MSLSPLWWRARTALATLILLCLAGTLAAQMPKLDVKYQRLELRAAPQVKQKIQALRLEGQRKNWTFQVGNTSVAKYLTQDARVITGGIKPTLQTTRSLSGSTFLTAPSSGGSSQIRTNVNANASRMDLRTLGHVSPVRDQGGCGSCWAFSSLATIESAHLVRNRASSANIDLSEQYALSCSGAGNCPDGGRADLVLAHFKNTGKGAPRETTHGYSATDASCPTRSSFTDYKVENWGWVGSNRARATVAEVKAALARYGAVQTWIHVNSSFNAYTNGVINDDDRTGWGGGHFVQIVGWDDAKQAYLIKNSWGTNWGMNGFGWVRYDVLGVGEWATWVTAKPIQQTDLNGYYSCNDGGHYYVRQVGNDVYWFGEHPNGSWANVFKGRLSGNNVTGEFFDVPKARFKGSGPLRLTISNAGNNISKVSGSFGGSRWTKTRKPARLPGARTAGFNANGNVNNLDGLWTGNDRGKYYVRQVGNKIAWFGEGNLRSSGHAGFANVAIGTRSGNTIRLKWADVPKCNMQGKGDLVLRVDNANRITKVSGRGFGGTAWTRPSAAPPPAPALVGTFTNKDAKTRGITRMVFSKGTASVRMFGSCSPSDCDWGTTRLTKSGSVYRGTYNSQVAKRNFTVTPLPRGEAKLVITANYHDSRPTKTNTYYFRKHTVTRR